MKLTALTFAILSSLAACAAAQSVERSVDFKEFGHDYAMTMTLSPTSLSFLQREKVGGGKNKTSSDKADLQAIRVSLKPEEAAAFEQIGIKFLDLAQKARETKPDQFTNVIGKVGLVEYKINWDGSAAWLTGNGYLRTVEVERLLTLIKQIPEAKAELAKAPAAPAPAAPPK